MQSLENEFAQLQKTRSELEKLQNLLANGSDDMSEEQLMKLGGWVDDLSKRHEASVKVPCFCLARRPDPFPPH